VLTITPCNFPVQAEVGVYIRYHSELILKPNFKKLKVHKAMDENIAILKLFPGINRNVVSSTLNTPGLKAVTLCNVTQCRGGKVEIGKYETSARQ
jgi:L-asparaginase